jgi:hypothetical protein
MTDPATSLLRPEPEPLFDAIGRVASAWAYLEAELGHLLVALLHVPMAAVLSIGQPFSVVHGQIKAILDLDWMPGRYLDPGGPLTEAQRQQVGEILKETRILADERNQVVHGRWLRMPNRLDEWINIRQRRNTMITPIGTWSIEEMHALARSIELLTGRVEEVGVDIDHRVYGPPDLDDPSPEVPSPPA